MLENTLDTPQEALEKIRGNNNLTSVSFLLRGFEVGLAVGLVFNRERDPDNAAIGTGFLIAPNLLLTNHHVIKDETEAEQFALRMNYQRDLNNNIEPIFDFAFRPNEFFATDEDLDYTVVAVAPRDLEDKMNLSEFGFLKIFEQKGKISADEFCTIIQHPDGRPKQIVLFENKITSTVHPDFLHYEADTVGGSSGSPVFNYEWVVVAVHHSGVPTSMAEIQGADGDNISENDIKVQGNEGIRISSIMAHLKANKPEIHQKINDAAATPLARTLPRNPYQFARMGASATNLEATAASLGDASVPPANQSPNHNPAIEKNMSNDSNVIRFNIPIEIRLGTSADGSFQIIPNDLEKKTDGKKLPKEKVSDIKDREGFDPNFLHELEINLNDLYQPYVKKKQVTPLLDESGFELKYTHFSVVLHKARKMCLLAAVNIDGNQTVKIPRENDTWFIDSRVKRSYQLGESVYSDNDLDRGHMVRREDPNWGANEVAIQADEDTFHYANACPQHKDLNQKTWLSLENYVLNNAKNRDLKVSAISGPVLDENYKVYRDAIVPIQFYKVVAMVKKDGTPSVTGYLLTQKELVADLERTEEEFVFSQFKTYQVPLAKIEKLTGLDLSKLKEHDPLKGELEEVPNEINVAGDLKL